MTIADLLPIRIAWWERPARKPKHRAIDEVERLQRLLNGAHLLIDGMRVQLDDKDHEHAEAAAARTQEIPILVAPEPVT